MKILSVAIFLFFLSFSIYGQTNEVKGNNKSETEVINVLGEMANAIIKRDAASLEAIFTDDYLDTTTEGVVFTKSEILALYKNPVAQPFGQIEAMKPENYKVRFYGDTAIVNVRAATTLKMREGNRLNLIQQYTAVLVKDKGKWRVATTHATRSAGAK